MLTESLTGGDYEPGTRLPSERVLAERYSVSRPVVREVMQRLRERGVIYVAQGSGAYLREMSALDWARPLDAAGRHRSATFRQLLEALSMIMRQAAELAADRATEVNLERIGSALSSLDRAGNLIDKSRSDIAYLALIAKAAHNPVIEMMFGAIAPLLYEASFISFHDARIFAAMTPFHREMLDALTARDGAKAASIFAKYIAIEMDMYGDTLDRPFQSLGGQTTGFGDDVGLEDVIDEALRRS
ncbi:FadR/GntR family transcriptional regulator [Microbacterium sp. CCH5-D1]|uniref:FadR/GntR family transcriptional regulator n=1 Tax=Microbacterium sp. CCH5-D1 TaxID=1768780 RepID=UPI00076A7AC6|nr:GntR family transcriptional regulator [Microbacterium sp. CCH5-D1]